MRWGEAWRAAQDGEAVRRSAWESEPDREDHWLATAARGPGRVYLFQGFATLGPYTPTDEDQTADDWTTVGEGLDV